jgi:hypothetical protein
MGGRKRECGLARIGLEQIYDVRGRTTPDSGDQIYPYLLREHGDRNQLSRRL